MGCHLEYNEEGKLIRATCGRGIRKKPCVAQGCNRPSTSLCDFPLGGSKLGQTCDKELCDSHATEYDIELLPKSIRDRVMEHDKFQLCEAHFKFVQKKVGGDSA